MAQTPQDAAVRRTQGAQLEDYFPGFARILPEGVLRGIDSFMAAWAKLGLLRYLIYGLMLASTALLVGPADDEILVRMGFFMLAALGLNVVVGLAGLLDLGYVAFFMIGAYTTAFFTDSTTTAHPFIVPVWLALIFAVAAAMITGIILGTPTLRLRGDYLAIVTLGFHEIVRQTAKNLSVVNGARGVGDIPHPSLFGIEFGVLDPQKYWFVLCGFMVLALIMIQHLKDSRVGRSWEAIREDEVAAAAMGVPVVKMKLYAFAIGASTSGLAGWALAAKVGFINPDTFPLLQSILVLCAVVIGGIGSSLGALLGAALVFGLPELLRKLGTNEILGFDIQTGRIAIFGFLLVVMMIFRPGGFISSARRRAELGGLADTAADTLAPEAAD